MKKFLLLIFVFAVSLLAYSPAEAIVHVEGRYWFTSLDSTVTVTDASVIGTEINLVDTLGVDDKKNFWEARVDLNLGSHHLIYAYMPLSWDGQKTLTQSVNFAGKTYTASTKVDSSLDIVYQRIGYRYDIIDTLGNQLGIIIDVKLLDIEARLKAASLGFDKSYSVTAPVPTIGLGAQVGLPALFSIGAEVTGIAYSGNHLIDGEGSINFNPIPFVTISGGYRLFDVKVADGDNKVDFKLKGPFLMVKAGW
ncbi:MAG: outer membrane beta-barrel protein [Deltaproteobacteria bacterium]|nr:outer membrane beta-barrel protein [Deltaproteobacteria bacterium]